MRLRFVTSNAGKVRELQWALGAGFEVEQDPRGYPEIQADTLGEVAHAGAAHLLAAGLAPPFVVEDSGLFVDALQGFPGVYSRYALDTIGIPGLLRLMSNVPPAGRGAHFASCFAFVDEQRRTHTFLGRCPGAIAPQSIGRNGFGFDPVFVPAGAAQTFGAMSPKEKAVHSHRAKAAALLAAYLKSAKR